MSEYASAWDAAVVAATLGTERRPSAPPEATGQLGGLIAALDWADAEGALLGTAAAVSLGLRAGGLPPAHIGAAVPTAPPEEQREPGEASAQHLAAMLQGTARAALPEWLDRLAALGMRAPADQLPALLTLGQSQAGLRAHILPVLGERGRWLAALNPAWSYAVAPPAAAAAAELWETGARPERIAALHAVRRADAAQARELLLSSWKTEKADDRAAFLEVLRAGLSLEDEPFLEAALDDRSKEVRAAAADLLCRLPGAQLVARMRQRAAPLLRWMPAEGPSLLRLRIGKAARLEAALPEACDKPMARDGVEPKPRGKLGERAWWLAQIVAAVPPAEWSERWQMPAEALVRAALDHEHADAVISGWWAAAQRHPDAAWAEALLAHASDRSLVQIGDTQTEPNGLTHHLPFERLERVATEAFGRGMHSFALLAGRRGQWSPALARAALAAIRAAIRSGGPSLWSNIHTLQLFGERIPPSLHAELHDGWPRDAAQWPQWEGYIERCITVVEFRYHALRALEEA